MAGNVASLSTFCAVARDFPWIRRVNPGPLRRATGPGFRFSPLRATASAYPWHYPSAFLTRGGVAVSPSWPEAAGAVVRGGDPHTLPPRAPASLPQQDWRPGTTRTLR